MGSSPEQHFRNDADSQANWLHVKVRGMLFYEGMCFFSSDNVGYCVKDTIPF